MITIKNRDRYPEVNFLADSDIRFIGDIGGIKLVLLGKEQGTNFAVVARCYSVDLKSEELFAIPLGELIAHSQESINITDQI